MSASGGDGAEVGDHVGPLSALGLVAGDCVGVFDLQGLIVGICPESLHPHRGGSYIGKEFRIAVGGLKQRLLLCVGECRGVGGETFEYYLAVEFGGGVGKGEPDVGKAESVALFGAVDADHACGVAVGNEVESPLGSAPVVVVFGHEQEVVAAQLFFAA